MMHPTGFLVNVVSVLEPEHDPIETHGTRRKELELGI